MKPTNNKKQNNGYSFPSDSMLKNYRMPVKTYEDLNDDPVGKEIIHFFDLLLVKANLTGIKYGPRFNRYDIVLPNWPGKKILSKIEEKLEKELDVQNVRIITITEGRKIGIEVPNGHANTVGFDEMLPELRKTFRIIPMSLGKTVSDVPVVIDVADTPHLVISGIHGSGKTVCINNLITSVLFTKKPDEVELILCDLAGNGLSRFNGIPHLYGRDVILDIETAMETMDAVVEEMERRVELFSRNGARKIAEYNTMMEEKGMPSDKIPYIVFIFDGFEDLMLLERRRFETLIGRITALGRFCGIHLVLSTKYPSPKIISERIKSCFPTSLTFKVPHSDNSVAVIGKPGAEKLLCYGDMLYSNPTLKEAVRIQGSFLGSELDDITGLFRNM